MADNMGMLTAKLTLDTTQFDSKLAKSTSQIEATAAAQERAAERARQAWEKELVAQDRAAQKAGQAARQKELAALKADILTRSLENAARGGSLADVALERLTNTLSGAATEMDRASASAGRLATAQQQLGASSRGSVTEMQAASGAIRLLEGGMGGSVRAAERFSVAFLGLGPLLEAAFPVVGALALGAAVWKMGEAAYKAFGDFVQLKGALVDIGALEIKVAQSSAVAADRVEGYVEDILSKTAGRAESLKQKYGYQMGKSLDLSSYFYSDQFKGLPDDVKAGYETQYKSITPQDIAKKQAQLAQEVKALEAAAQGAKDGTLGMMVPTISGYGPDMERDPAAYYESRLKIARQLQQQIQNESNVRTSQGQSIQTDYGEQQKSDAADKAQKAEEARRKALEAERAASEKQMQQFKAEYSALEQSHELAIGEEYDFWEKKLAATKQGSANWLSIYDKLGGLYQNEMRQLFAVADKATAQQKRQLAEQKQLESSLVSQLNSEAELAHKDADARAELGAANQKNADSIAQLILAHQVAAGSVTKYDAAVQMATLHAATYAAQLAAIDQEKANDDNDSSLNADQRKERDDKRAVRKSNITGEADRSALSDQWAVEQETVWGGAKDAIEQFVAASRDGASQMRNLVSSALGGFNEQAMKALSGKRTSFGNFGAGLAVSAGTTDLQRCDGVVLGSFGLKLSVAACGKRAA